MTLPSISRWFVGMLGIGLLAFGTALAWIRPDAVSVVAFITAGVVLLLAGLVPRLPSKVTVAGTSAEWKEALVREAYIATFEREAPHIVGGDIKPPGVAYGPDLEHLLEKARGAETAADLWKVVGEAEEIARQRIAIARTGALG